MKKNMKLEKLKKEQDNFSNFGLAWQSHQRDFGDMLANDDTLYDLKIMFIGRYLTSQEKIRSICTNVEKNQKYYEYL